MTATEFPYRDPDDALNSEKYHTGKPCIEQGCDAPAGTAWSPHWCWQHNAERIDRIDRHLTEMGERMDSAK